MQNSLDLAGVESSILFGNDFQVSLEGSPLLGRLIQVSCGAGQCTTSDCPWFLPGPLDFQGAPPASLFWERESLQVKPPHLLSSTSPFPHLVCKKLTHSLSPTNSGKTDCLHGSMSSHSTIRAANQPPTASLLPFHLTGSTGSARSKNLEEPCQARWFFQCLFFKAE